MPSPSLFCLVHSFMPQAWCVPYGLSIGGRVIPAPDPFQGYGYGNGRAMSVGEFGGSGGGRWELQLKGAGKTPFSRMFDGRAVTHLLLLLLLLYLTHALTIHETYALIIRDTHAFTIHETHNHSSFMAGSLLAGAPIVCARVPRLGSHAPSRSLSTPSPLPLQLSRSFRIILVVMMRSKRFKTSRSILMLIL